jgi:hypothetical protein
VRWLWRNSSTPCCTSRLRRSDTCEPNMSARTVSANPRTGCRSDSTPSQPDMIWFPLASLCSCLSSAGPYVRSETVVSALAQPVDRRRRLRRSDRVGFAERHYGSARCPCRLPWPGHGAAVKARSDGESERGVWCSGVRCARFPASWGACAEPRADGRHPLTTQSKSGSRRAERAKKILAAP